MTDVGNSFRANYYPPGTLERSTGPRCGEHKDEWHPGGCMLEPEHSGQHDRDLSSRAHVEYVAYQGTATIEFRSWHDSRALRVRTREEADELLAFLAEHLDATFGSGA